MSDRQEGLADHGHLNANRPRFDQLVVAETKEITGVSETKGRDQLIWPDM